MATAIAVARHSVTRARFKACNYRLGTMTVAEGAEPRETRQHGFSNHLISCKSRHIGVAIAEKT